MPQATKVSILGLGKSGFETALFLNKKGFDVFVSEYQDSEQAQVYAKELESKSIRVELGKHSVDDLLSCKWSVFSPGIKPGAEIYQAFQSKNIPIYSDIEVASWFSPAKKVIAVTGSCGKTTVTTLLTAIIKAAGHKVVSCGNIGNPWISEIEKLTTEHFIVLELSSFQLKNCPTFKADEALLLNISPNHLDWHADFSDYVDSKLKMFKNQANDQRSYYKKEDFQNFFPELRLHSESIFLLPHHDFCNPNQSVVNQVALALGIDRETIIKVVSEFKGIEHRLEEVAQWNGITFINDSKSTTVASLKWALERLPEARVLLVAGGVAKSKNFGEIDTIVKKHCKVTFLIGEAAPMIEESWQSVGNTLICASLDEAFSKAVSEAVVGDVVLFSPACASFDMFKNYEDRGRTFKNKVYGLIQG